MNAWGEESRAAPFLPPTFSCFHNSSIFVEVTTKEKGCSTTQCLVGNW